METIERKIKADKVAFFISLAIAIGLFVGGFFCPPMGVIDGSVLTAGGILMGFAVVAVGGQALHDGRAVTIKHGDTSVTVDDNED